MCSTRKKRATDTAEPNATVSHFSISVVNPFTQTGDILEFTFKKTSHFVFFFNGFICFLSEAN
jgi:hypothetical protein